VFNTQRRRFSSQPAFGILHPTDTGQPAMRFHVLNSTQPNSENSGQLDSIPWPGLRLHWEFICGRGQIFDYREHSQRQNQKKTIQRNECEKFDGKLWCNNCGNAFQSRLMAIY